MFGSNTALLQWGRACEDADRVCVIVVVVVEQKLLQWGRACEDADRQDWDVTSRPWALLQWGRACEDADRWNVQPKTTDRTSFNGAAPVRTRIVFTVTEAHIRDGASMGPRL